MPVVYRCGKCGYILDVFVRVGQNSYGVPTPSEVLSRYGGVCPRCGAPLNPKPKPTNITVSTRGMEKLVETLIEAARMMRISFRSVLQHIPEEYRQRILAALEEASATTPTPAPIGEEVGVEA